MPAQKRRRFEIRKKQKTGRIKAKVTRGKLFQIIKKEAVSKILNEMGELVQEIRLVGSTVLGKKTDIDIVIVTSKKLKEFTDEEYVSLLTAEEELTELHQKNYELYINQSSEIINGKPYITLWKRK